MDAKLWFWVAALGWTSLFLTLAMLGRRAILQGDVERHRRLMHRVMALVAIFLVSYVLKVVFLGKEDLTLWSTLDLWVLYTHESFVLLMVVAGLTARFQARFYPDWAADPRRRHRWAGRVAIVAGLCGLATAVLVVIGMVRRAGLLL